MTDLGAISMSKDDITDSAKIGSKHDCRADSVEISNRDVHTMFHMQGGPSSHMGRTKLCQEGDQAQRHADGYHSGVHKIGVKRTVTDGRRRSSVEGVDTTQGGQERRASMV